MDLGEWRKLNGLTTKALSEKLGVSEAAIRHYETKLRTPRRELAKRIQAATNGEVTAAELLGLDMPAPLKVAEPRAAYASNAVTITIPQPLFEAATEYGLDIAALVAKGGLTHLRAVFKDEYIRRNKAGIEWTRNYIEQNGTLSEQLGLI